MRDRQPAVDQNAETPLPLTLQGSARPTSASQEPEDPEKNQTNAPPPRASPSAIFESVPQLEVYVHPQYIRHLPPTKRRAICPTFRNIRRKRSAVRPWAA